MPRDGHIWYYPGFPLTIPVFRARCSCITPPFATVYCYTVRLACFRHAASVRPEPGSNSSLYGMDGSLRASTPNGMERGRVHHHDSVVKVQAAVGSGHGRIKNQGSAAMRLVTPGDVSGHTAGAFRRREGTPENRVVTSTTQVVRRRRKQRVKV